MENLLPCPFCKGEGIVITGVNQTNIYYVVQCQRCGARTKAFSLSCCANENDPAMEKAIKAWNRRKN